MPFPSIRAVLFDLDGTLIHSHIDFAAMRSAVVALAQEASFDAEPYRSRDVLRLTELAAAHLSDAAAFRARVEDALTAIELEACARAVEAEGARETLTWLLDQGLRVGIVTRNSPAAVAQMLERIPLPHEVLLTRSDTPRVKPDPLHLHLALQQLETPPAAAVMVGDHVMDVEGGKAAGMRTLGLLTPGAPADFFSAAAPDGVLTALPELRQWISR